MSPDQRHARDLHDLHDLLAAVGAEERAAASPLDVTGLRRLAHRRRAVRGATYSAVGLGAAAAITIGAVSVAGPWRTDRPLPPVDSPPVSSAPAPTPGAWPPAVTLGGATPGCGEPMPSLVAPDREAELTIEQVTQDGPLVAGGVAQVGVTIHGPAGFPLNADSPRLLLVRDGVVVATEAARPSDTGIVYSADEGTLNRPIQTLDLVRCETQGRGAVPLDAGAYDLYVVQDLLRGELTALDQMERLTIVGGPFATTLEAPTTDDAHPAFEDLVVTTAGLGPLQVGAPMTTNPGAAMLELAPDACLADDETYDGDPSRWIATYEPVAEFAYYGGDEMRKPFTVAVGGDGVLQRIDLVTDGIATSGGIRLGSTLAELKAAHPGVVEETAVADWSRAWVLRTDAGSIVFETIDWYIEGTDVVTGIRVFAPDVEPVLHAADSGDVAGSCV